MRKIKKKGASTTKNQTSPKTLCQNKLGKQ